MAQEIFSALKQRKHSPLDFLPQDRFEERVVSLLVEGVPNYLKGEVGSQLFELYDLLQKVDLTDVNVVIFGGGTGLANLIGGGSRRSSWGVKPFTGLKEVFPKVQSVVCVTDDGGSTGELLKELPLIALGDIRHVLLSSVKKSSLRSLYNLTEQQSIALTTILATLFNARLVVRDNKGMTNIEDIISIENLPDSLKKYLKRIYENLTCDKRLKNVLSHKHCVGNLLIVSAIYEKIESDVDVSDQNSAEVIHQAIEDALNEIGKHIGCSENSVMPCTSTPAQLRALYTNGVEIIGESKMSASSRGYPVESVSVDFCREPLVYQNVINSIKGADLILFAPGSLYSSIIPILKIPEIVGAVRANQTAKKLLVANLWVQAGETDLSIPDPSRKFLVSDMMRAYEQNIEGGTEGIFDKLLCLRLNDVPASILQRYAVEGKVPIYLDKKIVKEMGYIPIESGVYSKIALKEQGVIQHDADMLACAIKAVYCCDAYLNFNNSDNVNRGIPTTKNRRKRQYIELPSIRYQLINDRVESLEIECEQKEIIRTILLNTLWNNRDIPLSHINYIKGVHCIPQEGWKRSQKWDNVFSFYDPDDGFIKIRDDLLHNDGKFVVGFLIALGQSLLGNYALKKEMKEVEADGIRLGRVYNLSLRGDESLISYFSSEELDQWLQLTRMNRSEEKSQLYTRLLNKDEGFTPPGLFLGLLYAWYIDNRLASHIEYKMSVVKIHESSLVPEQKKMSHRRKSMVEFMRQIVFNPDRNT